VKVRKDRLTYVYLTKQGAKWKPEKEKKSKKEKKKEKAKMTKREVIRDKEIRQHMKTLNISYKEAEDDLALLSLGKGDIPALKEKEKVYAKPVGKPEERDIIKPEFKGAEKKVTEVHPQVEKKIISEVSNQELRAVKISKIKLKDLINEFLMNIVVRTDDAKKYGMTRTKYKSYLIKMIDYLGKSDASWLKHNIRVDGRQILQD